MLIGERAALRRRCGVEERERRREGVIVKGGEIERGREGERGRERERERERETETPQ